MGMRHKDKNWFEWVVFSIGLALLISAASFLIYRSATARRDHPGISFKTMNVEAASGGFNVLLEATNTGNAAMEDLLIEGSLRQENGSEEKVEIEIPLLPDESSKEITINFKNDPRRGQLNFRTVRFSKP